MQITSPVFNQGQTIPRKYTQFAEDISPPLEITNIPEGTISLALIVDDPDVPEYAPVDVWDHWTVFNIPPHITSIPENWEVEGVKGKGTRGYLDYSGPKPPDREHRYFFKLYALSKMLDLPEGASKKEVEEAMEGAIIKKAELIGVYAPE